MFAVISDYDSCQYLERREQSSPSKTNPPPPCVPHSVRDLNNDKSAKIHKVDTGFRFEFGLILDCSSRD
jgi:hypothetical protein